MPSATSRAIISPERPPRREPTRSTSAERPPSRTAVFSPFIDLCTSGSLPPPAHSTSNHRDVFRGGRDRRLRARPGRPRQDAGMATDVRTKTTDGVAVLTLSNPERRNALNIELSRKLADAVRAATADDAVGAIVVTGEDPAFCAGGDLSELATADPETLHTVYAGFIAVAECPLPTIAAVNGAAVGAGLNLALACDLRLAGPRARFESRFLQLGLHPGGGYTWMVQRVLGPQGAAALTLFGEVVDAAEA